MKRLALTVTGTVAGVAALLSFKTQTDPVAGGTLPSAGTGSTATTTSPTSPTTTDPTSTASPAATGTSSPTATSSAATPRTYTGQAVTTRYGVIQVQATIANGKITNVAFTQLTAFDGRSQQINSQAGPLLLQETLQNQTAQVDTISGASYTSEGYRESLQSALDKAGLK